MCHMETNRDSLSVWTIDGLIPYGKQTSLTKLSWWQSSDIYVKKWNDNEKVHFCWLEWHNPSNDTLKKHI
jgi:hypothetical protein